MGISRARGAYTARLSDLYFRAIALQRAIFLPFHMQVSLLTNEDVNTFDPNFTSYRLKSNRVCVQSAAREKLLATVDVPGVVSARSRTLLANMSKQNENLVYEQVHLEGRVKELELKDCVRVDPMEVGDTLMDPPYDAQAHYETTNDAPNPAPSPSDLSPPSVETTTHVTPPTLDLSTPDPSFPTTIEERTKWSKSLRDSTVIEAMGDLSLQSLQSLLILSINDYGIGEMSRFWNLIALCKRLSLQMGLRELVSKGADHNNTRILSLPNTIIEREERIRAFWMTEMLDSMSSLGAGWNVPTLPLLADSVLPCSDSLWAFQEHIITTWSFGEFKYSSAFSLCNILVATELQAVHSFLEKSLDLSIENQRETWQSEAQQLDERLSHWREEFVAAVFRLINAEFTNEERAEMEPNIVITNCLLNTAVIVLFERLASYPDGVERDYSSWAYATNRCIYACENMAAKIRRVNDDELWICNPHLVLSIFTAARFYIVYAKALDANVPANLHSLAYALNLSSKRWELARRYEIIIRTAVAEHKTAVSMSPHYPLNSLILDIRC
ncbi:hypothetical protein VE02_05461 [Pseudogymnoascus sp. 03VT05]|nr:hypothetical protein VE02_05461 [Pseudogymnoascus sp. 03VT05]